MGQCSGPGSKGVARRESAALSYGDCGPLKDVQTGPPYVQEVSLKQGSKLNCCNNVEDDSMPNTYPNYTVERSAQRPFFTSKYLSVQPEVTLRSLDIIQH